MSPRTLAGLQAAGRARASARASSSRPRCSAAAGSGAPPTAAPGRCWRPGSAPATSRSRVGTLRRCGARRGAAAWLRAGIAADPRTWWRRSARATSSRRSPSRRGGDRRRLGPARGVAPGRARLRRRRLAAPLRRSGWCRRARATRSSASVSRRRRGRRRRLAAERERQVALDHPHERRRGLARRRAAGSRPGRDLALDVLGGRRRRSSARARVVGVARRRGRRRPRRRARAAPARARRTRRRCPRSPRAPSSGPVALAREPAVGHREQLAADVLDDAQHEVVAVAEVDVERRPRELGPAHHLVDGQLAERPLAQERLGRGDDLLLGDLRRPPAPPARLGVARGRRRPRAAAYAPRVRLNACRAPMV